MKVLVFLIGFVTIVLAQEECPNDFQINVKTAKVECSDELEGQGGAIRRSVRQLFGGQGSEGGHRMNGGGHRGGMLQCIFTKIQNDPFTQKIKADCQQKGSQERLCVAMEIKRRCPDLLGQEGGDFGGRFKGNRPEGGRFGGAHQGVSSQEEGRQRGPKFGGGGFQGNRREGGRFGGAHQNGGSQEARRHGPESGENRGESEASPYGNPFGDDDDHDDEEEVEK